MIGNLENFEISLHLKVALTVYEYGSTGHVLWFKGITYSKCRHH